MPTSWKSLRARARLLRRLSWRQRALLVETTLLVGLARAIVLFVPFRRIAPYLGALNEETPADAPFPEAAGEVAVALRLVSPHTPWDSNCLARSLAGKAMLARRGLSSTFYLGVAKEGEALEAHAWLRCGPLVVTGGEGRERFAVVTRFGGRA